MLSVQLLSYGLEKFVGLLPGLEYVVRRHKVAIATLIFKEHIVHILRLNVLLDPVGRIARSRQLLAIATAHAVLGMVEPAKIEDRLAGCVAQLSLITGHIVSIAPGIGDRLAVATEGHIRAQIVAHAEQKVAYGTRLRLGEAFRAVVQILARIRRGARLAPAIVKVAIQVDAIAAAGAIVIAVLGPQAIREARVLIAIGISQWQKVPIDVSHCFIRLTLLP